jgi:hypothetical protein
MEYKTNKIYRVKCKVSYTFNVKADDILECMYKEFKDSKEFCWHTNQRNDNFGYAWTNEGFKYHFTEPQEVKSNVNSDYSFKTDKMNLNLLCADILEDGVPCAYIEQGDNAYFVGVSNPAIKWWDTFIDKGLYITYADIVSAYQVIEVEKLEESKNLAQELSKRYKKWHKNLRRKTCRRSRTLKKTKTFNVWAY